MRAESNMLPEFDGYAHAYAQLLQDPLRDRFAGDSNFFHARKWMLIRGFLARHGFDPARMSWLDAGCGQGDLLRLAGGNFRSAAGCDPSRNMIASGGAVQVYEQPSPSELPFADRSFDLVTAVCVYHHVRGREDRALLTESVRRVLKPQGLFCLIEHNPWNPVTRMIVKRCPVDADARLVRPVAAGQLMRNACLEVIETDFFLYLPEVLFRRAGHLENHLRRLPLGGQYAAFARRPS